MELPSVEYILGRLLEKRGGIEHLRALRGIRMHTRLYEDSLEGTCEMLITFDPHRSYTATDLGGRRYSSGFDGNREWYLDINGMLQIYEEPAQMAERMQLRKFDAEHFLLRPDEYEFSVDGSENRLRLGITSRAHRDHLYGTAHVNIDSETFDVVSMEWTARGESEQIYFDDPTQFDGYLFPATIRHVDVAGNETITKVTAIEINPEIDEALFGPPTDHSDHQFLTGVRRSVVPLDIPVDHMFVEVVIGGRGFNFMVDTGAGSTVLAEDVVEKLGLSTYGSMNAHGVSGTQAMQFVDLPELWVGDVMLRHHRVITTDFVEMKRRLPQLDGILGRDFLQRFVVGFDYVRREMTIVEREDFVYKGSGECLPLQGILCTMSFDGHQGQFRVDTGAPGLNIHAPFVRAKGLVRPDAKLPFASAIGGLGAVELKLYTGLTHNVKIGSYTLEDIPVRLTDMDVGPFANPSIVGNAGAEIWRRFITWFDFAGERFYIEPNSNFDEPPHIGRFGCSLKDIDGRHYIDSVITRSPAEDLGLRRDDEIIEIDGRPASDFSIDDLRMLFRAPAGIEYDMKIERPGEGRFRVRAVLRNFVPYYDRSGDDTSPNGGRVAESTY